MPCTVRQEETSSGACGSHSIIQWLILSEMENAHTVRTVRKLGISRYLSSEKSQQRQLRHVLRSTRTCSRALQQWQVACGTPGASRREVNCECRKRPNADCDCHEMPNEASTA